MFCIYVPYTGISQRRWMCNINIFGNWVLPLSISVWDLGLFKRHTFMEMLPIASLFAFCLPFQVYCAQQRQTSVYHLPATMVPHVLTIWVTMCACVPKDQYGTWAKTVMSCMMPVSWHHAPTVPASLGLTSSPATAQMASQGSTAPRMWMNVRATLAKASSPIVSMESMAIPATAPLDLEERPAKIMWPLAQRRHARMVALVWTSLTLGTDVSVLLGTRGGSVRWTLMNANLSLVRMEPSVKTGLTPTSVSVCLDFKATTVTWTSTSVPRDPVKTMAHVWMT